MSRTPAYCRVCSHARWHLERAYLSCSLRRVEFQPLRATDCRVHTKKASHRTEWHRKTS